MSDPRPAWPALLEAARRILVPAGLDLLQPFRIDRVNAELPAAHRLPDLGRGDALGLLVANTRALWPPFVAWLRHDPSRAELDDPLETYVESRIADAAARLPVATAIRFSHGPPERRIAAQRIAVASGLAHLSPTHLCVHPVVGPWLAIRGVIVADAAGPAEPPDPVADPCAGCTSVCREAFERALAASERHGPRGAWREWIAVRDACPVGRDHRYCDDQARYHGTVDRRLLRRLATA